MSLSVLLWLLTLAHDYVIILYKKLFNNYSLSPNGKKVVSDSPGLVDFTIGLVIFVLNLPDGQVFAFGKFKLQKDCN